MEIGTERGVVIKTKELAPKEKDKALKHSWNEEHEIANFDPKAVFTIGVFHSCHLDSFLELFTSKGSIGQLKIDNGLATLFKFQQGEACNKAFSL